MIEMKIVNNIKDLKEAISQRGGTVGFVPTMGALHQGHISLVKKCRKENDTVVVSVFVNPTQFNDKNDLVAYPRTEQADAELLQQNGCDIVFMPSVEEMYPETDTRTFDFGKLEGVMEGVNRPGHFNGVAQIVSKLFYAVEPQKAYFGEKDFQQLAIIRKMTKDLNLNTEIVGVEIFRDENGLALSSRNMLLSDEQLNKAPYIYQTISKAASMKWNSADEVQKWVEEQISKEPLMSLEYFTLGDETTLQPIQDWNNCTERRGFIVVRMGKVRLIDNIKF